MPKHNYTLIFKGRYSSDIRIDEISEEYLEELKNTPDDELFYKMLDENYGDELNVYGIHPYSGYIEVFPSASSANVTYESLGEPLITLQGDSSGKMKMSISEPSPKKNSIIAGCVTNQDGIIGHIDLSLNSPFDVKNLSVIYTSAKNYEAEGAITGIRYQDGKSQIEEYIDRTYFLDATPKNEMFYCSRFDEDLNEEPLYADGEWVV